MAQPSVRRGGLATGCVGRAVDQLDLHEVVRRVVQLIPERADGHYTINHLKRFVRSASLPDLTRMRKR